MRTKNSIQDGRIRTKSQMNKNVYFAHLRTKMKKNAYYRMRTN